MVQDATMDPEGQEDCNEKLLRKGLKPARTLLPSLWKTQEEARSLAMMLLWWSSVFPMIRMVGRRRGPDPV